MVKSVSREAYDDLYRQVEEEIRHGDYRAALMLGRKALTVARKVGFTIRSDRQNCTSALNTSLNSGTNG